MSYISQKKCKIIEGQLRGEQLANYLRQMNLEPKVWICEDGTGINAKVEYDAATDQLVGLVLPLDSKTGLPIPFTFLATSVENIEKYSKEPQSTLVYVVLAQPLMPNVPPFVIQIFGTDNKFNTENVLQRWSYTRRELKKYIHKHIQLIPQVLKSV